MYAFDPIADALGAPSAESTPPRDTARCIPDSSPAVPRKPCPVESSEFSLSRSLSQLLPEEFRVDSVPDFKPPCNSRTSPSLFSREHLPHYQLARQAVERFFFCSEMLFYIVPQKEAMTKLEELYSSKPENIPLPTFVEVMALAAVGSQYDDKIPVYAKRQLYETTRYYMDDCVEQDDLRGMIVLTLCSMVLILEKRIASWGHIAAALDIGRSHGLHLQEKPQEFCEADWIHWKKLWRTLVFFDSWLAGTLGRIPSIGEHVQSISELEPLVSSSATAPETPILHVEMVKIGVLMGSILENVYAPEIISIETIRSYMCKLDTWFEDLPQFMRLGNLLFTEVTGLLKASLYTIHLVYLGAIILLTRRVFVEVVTRPPGSSRLFDGTVEEALAYSEVCISAARQAAGIVGLLKTEGRLIKRCWLIVSSAFNAALLLLFEAAQKKSSGLPPEKYAEDLKDAGKSVSALEFCAESDELSRCYLEILTPFRNMFGENTRKLISSRSDSECSIMPSSLSGARARGLPHSAVPKQLPIPPSHGPSLNYSRRQTKYDILDMLQRPFGGESRVEMPQEDGRYPSSENSPHRRFWKRDGYATLMEMKGRDLDRENRRSGSADSVGSSVSSSVGSSVGSSFSSSVSSSGKRSVGVSEAFGGQSEGRCKKIRVMGMQKRKELEKFFRRVA